MEWWGEAHPEPKLEPQLRQSLNIVSEPIKEKKQQVWDYTALSLPVLWSCLLSSGAFPPGGEQRGGGAGMGGPEHINSRKGKPNSLSCHHFISLLLSARIFQFKRTQNVCGQKSHTCKHFEPVGRNYLTGREEHHRWSKTQ